jgi:excisionase family DNA binding protein
MTDKLCYSVPESAIQLSVSTRSIWRWIKEGKIQAVRLGSRVLVTRKALEAFLDEHIIQPGGTA